MEKPPFNIIFIVVILAGVCAGLVTFDPVSAVDSTRGLTVQHRVLNVSRGGTIFVDAVNAYEGEILRFEVVIATTGTASQTGVVVRETLSTRITLLSGDNLTGTGKVIGNLEPGETHTYTFEAQATGSVTSTVTNTARVESNEVDEISDIAKVTISKTPTSSLGLSIQKRVLNVSNNESTFRTSTTASDGDRIRFEIAVTATGSGSQTDVIVRDILPARLIYMSGDDLSSPGLNLGTMEAGEIEILTFDARVESSIATTITNTARVESDEAREENASATVRVVRDGDVDRDLSIDKRVRNISRGESSFRQSTTAAEGELVRFEIEIEAVGNADQTGVVLRDNMPSQLVYVSGDQLSGSGVNVGAMTDGQRRTYSFEARITGASGSTITNVAYVQSTQVSQKSDNTVINVSLPEQAASPEQRKSAFNLTQNIDASSVPARPGDLISYTLTFRNNGSAIVYGKIIEDEIMDVLELSEIVDQGGAASVDRVIRWASANINPGVEINRTFKVRIRQAALFPSVSDLVMTNIYGNEVRVQVSKSAVSGVITPPPQTPTPPPAPPRTGASETLVFLLAGLSTFGYWLYCRRLTCV